MEMISPAEWGAQRNYDDWADTQVTKDLIAIHWGGPPPRDYDGGTDREAAILRSYESYHLSKGWRGLAYGYAVGASGTVYRIRGRNNYGAHLGDQDGDGISNNKEVVPILWIMGEGQKATPQMVKSTDLLRKWLIEQDWTLDTLPVTGHRVIQPSKPTSCPGDDNMSIITSYNWDNTQVQGETPNAKWIREMKARYSFTQSDAVEVANYQGGSDVAFHMGVNGSPLDGWNLLLIMELAERIENGK